MNVEATLIEMMRKLNDPQAPNEAQWNRFARRAHRSLWGRRAAAIGTVGMTAFVGSSLADSGLFNSSPISPAASQAGEQDTSEVEVWFVKNGELFKTTQESSAGMSRNGNTGVVNMVEQLEDALERLFAGPPSSEQDLTSAIPSNTELIDFEVTPDEENDGAAIVTITVSDDIASADDQQLATAQVVYTATQTGGMDSVRMVIAGRSDETSEVKRRDDYEKGAPPIVVIIEREPGEGHVLYPGTVVMGTADPDGARLFYRLFGADDDVLSEGRIRMGPCVGSDCRRAFGTTMPFDIDKKERGRLEVYLLKPGKVPARVQMKLTLKPG